MNNSLKISFEKYKHRLTVFVLHSLLSEFIISVQLSHFSLLFLYYIILILTHFLSYFSVPGKACLPFLGPVS